jgi:CubicO group peptidase (beta-lactamase class C family)
LERRSAAQSGLKHVGTFLPKVVGRSEKFFQEPMEFAGSSANSSAVRDLSSVPDEPARSAEPERSCYMLISAIEGGTVMAWQRWCSGWTALLAILLATSRPAHADDELTRKIGGLSFDERIQSLLQEYGVPGAVVVVASPSSTVFLKGFGVRRLGASGAVDGDTRFQIASMSKFVAATAIATLVDRGIVSWDAPVQTFSPGTVLAEPYATGNATLRDYLAHRTGLPAYAGDLLPALGYDTDDLVRRARFLMFDHSFRAEWAYSNYGSRPPRTQRD